MDEADGLAKAIRDMTGAVVDQTAEDLQSKFAKVFALYRSDTAEQIREAIGIIQEIEASEGETSEARIADVKEKVIEIRAGLLELQECVDENTGVWSSEIKDHLVRGIAERMTAGVKPEGIASI